MPDIIPSKSINIETELNNLSLYKYHPNGILNISLNRIQDMLDGKVEITDPSNPFTYLLETSCLNTAFAIQEYTLLTRKLYPRLANDEKDLYLHMSDLDYLGRFSEPSYANVQFNILFNDFKDKAHYDPVQKEYVLKLPRHLKVSVDNYIFTLTSAIIIRLTENNVIDVKFENQDFNNIFPVETNYINFDLYKINQEETYLNFSIKMPEVDIEHVEIPIEKSKLFKNKLTYNPKRQFYFFRAFHLLNGVWEEMTVTHTDQIYDIYKPTCIINVFNNNNNLEYYIPPVYINTGRIGTKVKFLIYTTNGSININFNDYKIANFSNEYNNVFPDIELDKYTRPLQLISKVIYIKDEVIDGKDSIPFTNLKKIVIENSIGDRKLPITNKQLEFESEQNNFRLIKTTDVLNKRIFLLESKVPNALTRYPVSKFNLDIIEYKTKINDLILNKNGVKRINNNITIIPEHTVFNIVENKLYLLDKTEHTQLIGLSNLELTNEVNNNNYVSTFYHYILDTTNNETNLRAYDISSPFVKLINFKEFNSTSRVGINTTNINIFRTPAGLTMDIMSNLKKYINTINETNIKPYIIYTDNNDSRFYLEGNLFTSIGDKPVYRFRLDTDFHIDSDNKLYINNFKDNNENTISVNIDLDTKLSLVYISNIIPNNYQASIIDENIYNSFLSVGKCGVTLEEITVKFGYYLERLYTQIHSSTGLNTYEIHTEDVPMRYESTVYNPDNTVKHTIGEIVHDTNNEIIYKYRIGDYKLDSNNNPIKLSEGEIERYLNLLFIDYKANLSNKTIIQDYRNYIKKYLTEKITENATVIQDQLLENSESFIIVPKNISSIKVKTPFRTTYIESMQNFKINIFVNERVYNDIEIRDNVVYTVIKEIDEYLYDNKVLNKTQLLNILYSKLKEFINSISIERFTELDEEYIEILDENARVSLNKLLITEADGYNIKDDVTIQFMLIN